MKNMKKVVAALTAVVMCGSLFAFAACGGPKDPDTTYYTVTVLQYDTEKGTVSVSDPSSDKGYVKDESVTLTVTAKPDYTVGEVKVNSAAVQLDAQGKYTFHVAGNTTVSASFADAEPAAEYGLPVPEAGRYITNPSLFEEEGSRWLVYTTNLTAGETDNAIAVRKGTYEEGADKGWKYGEETVLLEGGEWDEYLGSASVVKGTFEYGGTNYGWLMAYCGTSERDESAMQIGLAVATSVNGTWTKVGEEPIITFDDTGDGCYAPSLINYDGESGIRLFYTKADPFGHYGHFVDFDASDLDTIALSGSDLIPFAGVNSDSMFGNGGYAYDATGKTFWCALDVSGQVGIAVASIAESKLYTADGTEEWALGRQWDRTDTPDMDYSVLFGACIVTDAFGHVDGATEIEMICTLRPDTTEGSLYGQILFGEVYTAAAE